MFWTKNVQQHTNNDSLSCTPLIQLNNISLTYFKNHAFAKFQFEAPVVAICGANGVGKTNLLDAIHYLCLTKSYFTGPDSQHIHNGKEGFRIEGNWVRDGQPEQLAVILRENGKKEVLANGQAYARFSEHIGKYPCVMIAPDDIELINGAAEVRRKFLDTLLSQLDADYLQTLITYNKLLQQRNSFLKMAGGNPHYMPELLQTYDERLSVPGDLLYRKRANFLPSYFETASGFYARISGEKETPSFVYESKLQHAPMAALLEGSRDKDLMLQRTTCGIHRDEVQLLMNGQPFRHKASQGQKKSLLFALKLAEAEIIRKEKGFPPVLLLDDVFEKLDADRMHHLLEYVCKLRDGQVFITDTHRERITRHFEELNIRFQLIELS